MKSLRSIANLSVGLTQELLEEAYNYVVKTVKLQPTYLTVYTGNIPLTDLTDMVLTIKCPETGVKRPFVIKQVIDIIPEIRLGEIPEYTEAEALYGITILCDEDGALLCDEDLSLFEYAIATVLCDEDWALLTDENGDILIYSGEEGEVVGESEAGGFIFDIELGYTHEASGSVYHENNTIATEGYAVFGMLCYCMPSVLSLKVYAEDNESVVEEIIENENYEEEVNL